MPHASRLHISLPALPAAKNIFSKKISALKAKLNNEIIQKTIIFATILALLLLAANLENIM